MSYRTFFSTGVGILGLSVAATLGAGVGEGAGTIAAPEPAASATASEDSVDRDGFATFISPAELKQFAARPGVVVVDVRSAEEYATAHIPGAINLPGESLRTPSAKPGEGDSQYIFRDEQGEPDVERYEEILGEAGISREQTAIIYGNHAGKADGSVPAMLLDWLGQEKVLFLDGVGLSEWYAAGFAVTSEPTEREATTYDARPRENFVWNLDEVLDHVGTDGAVFYDTRALDEFEGSNLKGNRHGGHIPGAIRLDYADFLTEDKTLKPRDEIVSLLEANGLDRKSVGGRPVVLYCQTATRVSLPYLALRELGYEDVAIYDASWHEYGNRDDTPVEK